MKTGDWTYGSALEYRSPATKGNTYEDTKESVETINKLWDDIGVTVKRQSVSFDNTDADGHITTTTAFSILENSKSEDADDVYRDLKELLLELGYFAKPEFDALETNVLKWFIPSYNPKYWPMNDTGDYLEYGCFLYPHTEGENINSAVTKHGKKVNYGFAEGCTVIAPGNCEVVEVSGDIIKIKFDSTNQPEINVVNDYVMVIKGINISVGAGAVLSQGDEIGTTGTEKIQVYMKNDRQAIINNVYDYMKPRKGSNKHTNWEYFFFTPYESGHIDIPENGAGMAATFTVDGATEWAVGICQWTIRGDMNLITPFIQELYAKDPEVCKRFAKIKDWDASKITSNYEEVQEAFIETNKEYPDEFLELQWEYALSEKKATIEGKGLEWVFDDDRNGAVAGILMSLINWRPAWEWESVVDESMSDEEVVKQLSAYAVSRSGGSDVSAAWISRWKAQAAIALDIIYEEIDAEEFYRAENGLHKDWTHKGSDVLDDVLRQYGY